MEQDGSHQCVQANLDDVYTSFCSLISEMNGLTRQPTLFFFPCPSGQRQRGSQNRSSDTVQLFPDKSQVGQQSLPRSTLLSPSTCAFTRVAPQSGTWRWQLCRVKWEEGETEYGDAWKSLQNKPNLWRQVIKR